MMMTMKQMKMKQMIGIKWKKRKSGILTLKNSMCPNQKVKKHRHAGKKGAEEEDDFKVDDEFKDMFNDSDDFDDDEEDDY